MMFEHFSYETLEAIHDSFHFIITPYVFNPLFN